VVLILKKANRQKPKRNKLKTIQVVVEQPVECFCQNYRCHDFLWSYLLFRFLKENSFLGLILGTA